MRPPKRLALAALSLAVLAGGCAKSDAVAVEGANIEALDASFLPATVTGLTVQAEKVGAVQSAKSSFVDEVGLYSLRQEELLQATLQISRFTEDADLDDASFRQAVVQQIGSTVPRAYRMGEETVYMTTGRRQSVAVWFRERYLFVLSTREEFELPRSLLRELLKVEPA